MSHEGKKESLNAVAANTALLAASRYARRCWWADREDLEQEAMVAAFAATKTWDEKVGVEFGAYAYRACLLHLRRYLWKNSAPVSAADKKLTELRGLHRAELVDDDHRCNREWADQLLADADWQFRAFEQIEYVLTALQKPTAMKAALQVLLEEERPARVAARLNIPIDHVYRATKRAKEVLGNNAALLDLLRE